MANYDELRKKAKDAFDTLADVSVEAYKLAEEKARILAKKAKLNAGIANERATIRRLHVEIGDKYFKLHKDNSHAELRQQCEDVAASYERIAAKQRELEELKSQVAYDAENAEFEKEASEEEFTESCCSQCDGADCSEDHDTK